MRECSSTEIRDWLVGGDSTPEKPNQIAVSLPSWEQFGMSRELDSIGLSYITLKDAFSNLIRRSKEELSICSPFADYEGLQPFKQEFLRAMKRKVRTRLLTRIASSRGQRLKLRHDCSFPYSALA
ncbi:MAG: hypothetical protein ACE5KV_02520, partial [Thermoplasmata archaeon]